MRSATEIDTEDEVERLWKKLKTRNAMYDGLNFQLGKLTRILANAKLPCAVCGKPATCIGSYESNENPYEPACDNCCGHGNEDGHCEMVGYGVKETTGPNSEGSP